MIEADDVFFKPLPIKWRKTRTRSKLSPFDSRKDAPKRTPKQKIHWKDLGKLAGQSTSSDAHKQKKQCYLLPLDKSFEADVENLAIFALERYHTELNYELVKAGPLVFGTYWEGFIVHLNFEIKDKAEPDAEGKTFFTELTMKNNNLVAVSTVLCLGQSKALPERAVDRSCVYCLSQNIHHPELKGFFRNGRADHGTFLSSQMDKLNDCSSDGLKDYERVNPLLVHPRLRDKGLCRMFVHPRLHYFIRFSNNLGPDFRFAHEALSMYNAKEGKNMEVVDMGTFSVVLLSFGCYCHLNFKAKNRDDSSAPTQTFFAEVIRGNNVIFVDYCECVGSSDSLPDKADLRGCCFCDGLTIHHPPGQGYLTGRELVLGDLM